MSGEIIELHGLQVQVIQDEDTQNPRTDYDHLGHMFCWHPDYQLGDEQFTRNDFEDLDEVIAHLRNERKAIVILPLYLYDHSGITISVGNPANTIDPGGWDTTAIGFVWTSVERLVAMGHDANDLPDEETLTTWLKGEVEEYDNYLTGDVYGVIVGEGEWYEDACWGFNGYSYAVEEAERMAKAARERVTTENIERALWAARDVVTV